MLKGLFSLKDKRCICLEYKALQFPIEGNARFFTQELPFLLMGTVVSLNGNARFLTWKLLFPTMGTEVILRRKGRLD